MEVSTLIFYIIGSLIGLLIFYNIVKAAVRNGIREARKDMKVPAVAKSGTPEVEPNENQLELQERYNRGEITFEAYKAEWEKMAFIQP